MNRSRDREHLASRLQECLAVINEPDFESRLDHRNVPRLKPGDDAVALRKVRRQ